MLFVGDDWAEDHHDVEVQDDSGRRLARARLPEGLAGIERLHALIGSHLSDELVDADPREAARSVVVGIETDRGPWVQALVAAGYQVYPINPMSVARYRERHSTSGAKSIRGDAHVLADLVRAGPRSAPAGGRGQRPRRSDQDRRAGASEPDLGPQRHVLRLRSALREFFPAALEAFDDLDRGRRGRAAGRRADHRRRPPALTVKDRRGVAAGPPPRRGRRAAAVQELLRAPALRQPAVVEDAYAAIVTGTVRLIAELSTQIDALGRAGRPTILAATRTLRST